MQALVDRDMLASRQLIEPGELLDRCVHARHARRVWTRPRRCLGRVDRADDRCVQAIGVVIGVVIEVVVEVVVGAAGVVEVVIQVVIHATTVPVDAWPLR